MNNSISKNYNKFYILTYILKIWVLTSLLSAIPIQLISVLQYQTLFCNGFLLILLFSLIFSFPTMIILVLIIKNFTNKKEILIIISIFLVFVTFFTLGFTNLKNVRTFLYPTIYTIVISILILTINIDKPDSEYMSTQR